MVLLKDLSRLAEESKKYLAVASIAPSYLAEFTGIWKGKLVGLLKEIFNIKFVGETASMLPYLAKDKDVLLNQCSSFFIDSSCPVILRLIKKDYPALKEYISPLSSPMMMHGKYLKRKFGASTRVYFFGPCPEKSNEFNTGSIDGVFTFREVKDFIVKRGIELNNIPEVKVDQRAPDWSRLAVLHYKVSGIDQCKKELRKIVKAVKQESNSNYLLKTVNSRIIKRKLILMKKVGLE